MNICILRRVNQLLIKSRSCNRSKAAHSTNRCRLPYLSLRYHIMKCLFKLFIIKNLVFFTKAFKGLLCQRMLAQSR
jgi:hypothetical protein